MAAPQSTVNAVEKVQAHFRELQGTKFAPTASTLYASAISQQPEDLANDGVHSSGAYRAVLAKLDSMPSASIRHQGVDFVHVRLDPSRESKTASRVYLNPRADHSARIVESLTEMASGAKIPLYFKFVNLEGADAETQERADRVVVFVGEKEARVINQMITRVAQQFPGGFRGRSVAGFAHQTSDGIGVADDPNAEQREHFGRAGKISANDLRAMLVMRSALATTVGIVRDDHVSSQLVRSTSIRDVFLGHLKTNLANVYPQSPIAEAGSRLGWSDPQIVAAADVNFGAKALEEKGFGRLTQSAFDKTVRETARDVLPAFNTESLAVGVQAHLEALAPTYGISPKALSQNLGSSGMTAGR